MVEPHFKGIVDCPDPKYLALVEGKTAAGRSVEEGEMLRLLDECPSIELVTDVRRAVAAALRALDEKYQLNRFGVRPTLGCHEGCPHRVGTTVFRGAQLMRKLWETHVPETKTAFLPRQPILDYYADCTDREAQRGMEHLAINGEMEVITDSYQRPRSERYLKRNTEARWQKVRVLTPQEVQAELSHDIETKRREFFDGVMEIVDARFAGANVLERERKDEKKYRVLHGMAAVAERLHLPNPERSLAAWLRSDKRLRKKFSRDGVELQPPEEGLPLRELDDGTQSDFFAS